jgi:hypothetical protein
MMRCRFVLGLWNPPPREHMGSSRAANAESPPASMGVHSLTQVRPEGDVRRYGANVQLPAEGSSSGLVALLLFITGFAAIGLWLINTWSSEWIWELRGERGRTNTTADSHCNISAEYLLPLTSYDSM